MTVHLSGPSKGAPSPLASLVSCHPSVSALSLVDLTTLWRVGCAAKKNRVLTYGWFQKVFSLTTSQARSRIARLVASGVLERALVGHSTRPEGYRYALTSLGTQLCQLFAPALSRARPSEETTARAGQGGAVESRSVSLAGQDLRPHFSAQALATLEKASQAARDHINAALSTGQHPDYEQLAQMGVPDPFAQRLHNYVEALLDGSIAPSTPNQPCETRVPAASPERVASARAMGVPIPSVSSTCPEGEALASTATLAVEEAAVRHPDLLRGGQLVARLPEILWSVLSGPLADYGPPIIRVRTALKLLSSGRWQTPKGLKPRDLASLRAQFAVAA